MQDGSIYSILGPEYAWRSRLVGSTLDTSRICARSAQIYLSPRPSHGIKRYTICDPSFQAVNRRKPGEVFPPPFDSPGVIVGINIIVVPSVIHTYSS